MVRKVYFGNYGFINLCLIQAHHQGTPTKSEEGRPPVLGTEGALTFGRAGGRSLLLPIRGEESRTANG